MNFETIDMREKILIPPKFASRNGHRNNDISNRKYRNNNKTKTIIIANNISLYTQKIK